MKTFNQKEIDVIEEILSFYTKDWIDMLLEQRNLTKDEIQSFWNKIKIKEE